MFDRNILEEAFYNEYLKTHRKVTERNKHPVNYTT